MNTYYLRTVNYGQLLDFGTRLGVIRMHYDSYEAQEQEVEGMTVTVQVPVGEGTPIATDNGHFDYIGVIERPTGETTLNEFGDTVPVTAPIVDGEGTPYIHANLITPHNIRALAIASADPEIQAALSEIATWFIVDGEGNAIAPNNPHRVFA